VFSSPREKREEKRGLLIDDERSERPELTGGEAKMTTDRLFVKEKREKKKGGRSVIPELKNPGAERSAFYLPREKKKKN